MEIYNYILVAAKYNTRRYFNFIKKTKFGKIIGLTRIEQFVKYLYFSNSLQNKKLSLKTDLFGFTKDLYIYMTFRIIPDIEKELNNKYVSSSGIDKYDLPIVGITEKDLEEYEYNLYLKYISIINRSLRLNQENVSLKRLEYFLKIQKDILAANLYPSSQVSFIYQNKLKDIKKLKIILDIIYEYSTTDDYFTLDEFRDFLKKYREYFKIEDIDIFKSLNKIPKRLKKRKGFGERSD